MRNDGGSDSTGGDEVLVLTPAEVAKMLRLSESKLKKMRQRGVGPPVLQDTGRVTRYPRAGVLAWIAASATGRDAVKEVERQTPPAAERFSTSAQSAAWLRTTRRRRSKVQAPAELPPLPPQYLRHAAEPPAPGE